MSYTTKSKKHYEVLGQELYNELLEKEAGVLTYARKVNLPKIHRNLNRKLIPYQQSHGAVVKRQARTASKRNLTFDKIFGQQKITRKRLMSKDQASDAAFQRRYNAFIDSIV